MLLPTHEQGFLFARVQDGWRDRVGLALPSFESYRAVHGKAGFSRLLDRLGLPQPRTQIVTSAGELRDAVRFPAVVKTAVGTASRGIWFVREAGDLERALQDLDARRRVRTTRCWCRIWSPARSRRRKRCFVVANCWASMPTGRSPRGAGGGEAIKQSVSRPRVRDHVAEIGRELGWHGALSVDYIMPDDGTAPLLIDCNPRLVEPMSAVSRRHRSGRTCC